MYKKTHIIINNFNELKQVKSFINELGRKHKIEKKIILHIQLALEELIVNIISYSYEDEKIHKIQLTTELYPKKWILHLINQGKIFNPLKYKSTNIQKSLEERKPGGTGILLARNLMDDMSYSYQNGHNQLTLIKNVKSYSQALP